ncbi:actin cross-linking [Coprinellus micaceus]|uniref:Cofilin n=1 Tax=Coprinellus micaceus TaxID=71717 RepID=A0A4Y7SMJ9_COPMI|nr:actin cross-linking [Coprinellus micaceus]
MSLEEQTRNMQERTFCKWLNTKLEANAYPPMSSLVQDLSDGVRLIQLMRCRGRGSLLRWHLLTGDTSLGRYNRNPRMRVQKAENVTKALEFITSRGVKLTNIGPEAYSGMIWTLILRFTIADISEEGLSAKEGLLLWCQRKTAPYQDVKVQDFTHSWSDGLALCALIHCHRPDLLDYDRLDKEDRHGNTRLAFQIAADHLDIPQLLEVEDLCDSAKPDERSVMTYIASFFHAFSSMEQTETESRRVEKFADLMQSVWIIRTDYERRARLLLENLERIQSQWAASVFMGTYVDAKEQSAQFTTYKQTTKRTWVTERQDVITLFGNVQTKLKTYSLAEYVPPKGLAPLDLDAAWKRLLESEAKRSRAINAEIRKIKEGLRKKFADIANAFEAGLHSISVELTMIEGPLEEQQQQAKEIQTRIPQLSEDLALVADAEAECMAANVEENDYTVFTWQDLEFELGLLIQNIAKKISFIDNQIVSRDVTNLTPAQIEQFETTFRYFDKDETNTLNQMEMMSALASLGIVYSNQDVDYIYEQLVGDYGAVTFEAFINLLVDITEDQTTPTQLLESFQGIAHSKPFITELDLRLAHIPQSSIDYLLNAMPSSPPPDDGAEPEYDYVGWLDEASGVSVNNECLSAFQDLKLGKKHKYILYALNAGNTEIVVEKTSSGTYEDFLGDLPEGEPRFAIFDFEFEKEDGGKRNKILFISWSPDGSKIKQKMVYASSKDALRRSLQGIAFEVQGTDLEEVSHETVLEKVSKGN